MEDRELDGGVLQGGARLFLEEPPVRKRLDLGPLLLKVFDFQLGLVFESETRRWGRLFGFLSFVIFFLLSFINDFSRFSFVVEGRDAIVRITLKSAESLTVHEIGHLLDAFHFVSFSKVRLSHESFETIFFISFFLITLGQSGFRL